MLCGVFAWVSADAATIAKPAPSNGLVAWWRFDEGTSTVVGDFSGNSKNGTLTNFAFPATASSGWSAAGKRGGSLRFDGVDDYFQVAQPAIVSSPNTFTIAGWIYPDNQYSRFITPNSNGIDQWVGYDTTNQRIEFQITEIADVNNRNRPSTTGSVPRNMWTHWAVTINDKDIRIYINGALNASYTETIDIAGWTGTWSIGQRGNSADWFKGRLDDLRVYNRTLSASEVSALYRAGQISVKVPDKGDLAGWWKFDDATGTVATDFSGNGNPGTLFCSGTCALPTYIDGKRGKALDFVSDGTNYGAVSIPSTVPSASNNQITVSAWYYYKGGGGDPRIINRGWCSSMGWLMHTTLGFGVNNSTGCSAQYFASFGSLTAGRWYHIVGVFDGTNVYSYRDGVRIATTVSSGVNLALNNYGMTFMTNNNGKLDDVRIFKRALSATEVAALYKQNQTTLNAPEDDQLTEGLVSFWTFNGKDVGSLINDVSGGGNNAYARGVATSSLLAVGKVGQGLNFNNSNYYVSPAAGTASAVSNITTNQVTVSAWVYPYATNQIMTVISNDRDCGGCGSYKGFGLQMYYGGTTVFRIWNSDGTGPRAVNTATNPPANEWTHVVGTFDGSSIKIYQNGSLLGTSNSVGNGTLGYPSSFDTKIGQLGCCTNTHNMNGKIDEVRVYNRTLTAAEVKRLYLMGK